jgi:RNA polymerase sigma-70 factor, ECF subfamily
VKLRADAVLIMSGEKARLPDPLAFLPIGAPRLFWPAKSDRRAPARPAVPRRAAAAEHDGAREPMGLRSVEPELRALMVAGLDGDAAAHRVLLTKVSALLRGYFKGRLARIGRDAADAEDLVQETLISIHTRRHTYDRSHLLTPWVFAIARYRLIDYLRRTNSSATALPLEEAEDVPVQGEQDAADSHLDLDKLFAELTPKTRQAIQLVKLDGLSVAEAAARAGMSQSAIKVSVHRGLRALSMLIRRREHS